MVQVLKRTLGRHRPTALYAGIEQYSFPSGHATNSAVVLASLAFLLTRGQEMRWRFAVGSVAAVYVSLVGFSRLYLGAHWLSDVLGGFSFGLAAAALSGMVYTQHQVHEAIRPKRMAIVAGATIVIAGGMWGWWRAPADLRFYASAPVPAATTLQAWMAGGYRELPQHRREIAGERKEAFTLQIACPEAKLREAVRHAGWVAAPALSIRSVLEAIAPHPEVAALPLLPQYDGGLASGITAMQPPPPHAHARNVLRLWKSGWEVAGGLPIWYGAYAREVQVRPDYGFLRREPQLAAAFSPELATAGLRRLPVPVPSPELWACGPGT